MSSGATGVGGIYVHFPYCSHRCSYCDFNLTTPRTIPQQAYTDAVVRELRSRAPGLGGPARSLYFGGGTPSLWEVDQLARVITVARQTPGLLQGAEVTLEANPAQVEPAWLDAVLAAGVNRLSIGIQATEDALLRAITRRHTVEGALRGLALVADAPLASYSVDLMFGLPGQSLAGWEATLRQLVGLSPPHLSIYNLTVEPRTVLAAEVAAGRTRLADEDVQAEMFMLTHDRLSAAGYDHYEVSAFALPGHRAVHNAGYWQMRPYLGIGAGAHGFVGRRRTVNIRRPRAYMEAARATGLPTASEETLDDETLAFERLMTGLRQLSDGVLLDDQLARFEPVLRQQQGLGRIAWLADGRVRVTREGMRLMDSVLLAALQG